MTARIRGHDDGGAGFSEVENVAAKSFKLNIFSIERVRTGQVGNPRHQSGKHMLPNPLTPSATILIVDDEEPLLEYVRLVLERAGYRVLSARNGGEAWDLIVDRHEICLLLTDIVMPGSFDGLELARRVRQQQPGLPVLLMTGAAQHDPTVNRLPWKGMILRKPFRPDQLLTIVRENLEAANRPR
ncbi:MAG: response regulator [Verrucomicrobia bacterium]|nr:response regulator [Verrucomicrobiota bacterium]